MASSPPRGVKILAGFQAFSGVLMILLAIVVTFLGGMALTGMFLGLIDYSLVGIAGFAAVLAFLVGGWLLVMAWGLWNLRAWAWWIQVIFGVLDILIALASRSWWGLIMPAIIVGYLYSARKAFFGKRDPFKR